jgi:hypothetical protein
MIRISLDENQFKELISGRIVKVSDVEIALQDIGFITMLKDFYEIAQRGQPIAFGPVGPGKGVTDGEPE